MLPHSNNSNRDGKVKGSRKTNYGANPDDRSS